MFEIGQIRKNSRIGSSRNEAIGGLLLPNHVVKAKSGRDLSIALYGATRSCRPTPEFPRIDDDIDRLETIHHATLSSFSPLSLPRWDALGSANPHRSGHGPTIGTKLRHCVLHPPPSRPQELGCSRHQDEPTLLITQQTHLAPRPRPCPPFHLPPPPPHPS